MWRLEMRLKMRMAATVIACTIGAGTLAYAATPDIVAAIKARQANFKEIGGDFKTVGDEIKSGAPDLAAVRSAARDLNQRAGGQAKYFVPGSGPDSGVKTRAQPAIWSDAAGFTKMNDDLVRAAADLDAAAQKGDVTGLVAARSALGTTCKGCHEKYRAQEE